MDTILQKEKEQKGINKGMLAAILVAVLLVVGGIGVLLLQPSMEQQKQQALEGAYRPGSPEFEALTKKIFAENDEDNTWYSPVGTGYIMMNIVGRLRNMSDQTLTGLEINVAVLDRSEKVVKDKTLTVVPNQQAKLDPKGEMTVTVRIDGFQKDDDRARIRWKVTAIKTEK